MSSHCCMWRQAGQWTGANDCVALLEKTKLLSCYRQLTLFCYFWLDLFNFFCCFFLEERGVSLKLGGNGWILMESNWLHGYLKGAVVIKLIKLDSFAYLRPFPSLTLKPEKEKMCPLLPEQDTQQCPDTFFVCWELFKWQFIFNPLLRWVSTQELNWYALQFLLQIQN